MPQVKRIIGQGDSRLCVPTTKSSCIFHGNKFSFRKKNQLKAELESKRKAKGDEVIREMFAF